MIDIRQKTLDNSEFGIRNSECKAIPRNLWYGKALFSVATMLLITCYLLLTLTACGRKEGEAPANMEALYRNQGVPIRIVNIQPTEFIKEIDYNVRVTGLRETPVNSMVGDKVQRVRARIGDSVNQHQIIIDFPDDNVSANYHQAQAAFNLAEQTLQRMQTLFTTGGVSQQELDGAETQFKVARANLDAVRQAVYARAPIAGIITDINVREGQRVNPGDYLFTVSQLNRLHGKIWISEDDINFVPQNAEVYFRWNNIEKRGRVTNIALSVNRDNNAFAADLEIENADLAVRSGVTGKANIVIYKNENAIVVPRNVVLRDENGQQYVYLLTRDQTATRRNITIGNYSELNFEVVAGLEPNDVLITQGLQHITEGSKVLVQ